MRATIDLAQLEPEEGTSVMTAQRRRRSALARGTSAVADLLSACAPPSACASADSERAFEISLLVPTTGPLRVYCRGSAHGGEAASNVLNDRGGVLGGEVRAPIANTAGDPVQSVTHLHHAVARSNERDRNGSLTW